MGFDCRSREKELQADRVKLARTQETMAEMTDPRGTVETSAAASSSESMMPVLKNCAAGAVKAVASIAEVGSCFHGFPDLLDAVSTLVSRVCLKTHGTSLKQQAQTQKIANLVACGVRWSRIRWSTLNPLARTDGGQGIEGQRWNVVGRNHQVN
eukprot:jgi/Bigna1/80636/fgenesh1_pg.73_\